ncbi:hypothetical protein XENOCAPTIV_002758 [Xenoophorus captivus]|uniref:Uncharacterized protein n=1 Tax=Xenoophorus captivus TaxID=1517983 RepID=A0ABV0R6G8_9TELE
MTHYGISGIEDQRMNDFALMFLKIWRLIAKVFQRLLLQYKSLNIKGTFRRQDHLSVTASVNLAVINNCMVVCSVCVALRWTGDMSTLPHAHRLLDQLPCYPQWKKR